MVLTTLTPGFFSVRIFIRRNSAKSKIFSVTYFERILKGSARGKAKCLKWLSYIFELTTPIIFFSVFE